MENVKLNPVWETLYNLNFPTKTPTVTPDVSSAVSEIVQSVATSPTPASPSGENNDNGKFIRNVLILAGIGLAIYGGYRWYTKYQKKKDKELD